MKIFNRNFKILWHRWPLSKTSHILSVYEFAMYILVFIGVLFLYWKIQHVPYHSDEISANLIKFNDSDEIYEGRIPKSLNVNIKYKIPASFTLNDNDRRGKFYLTSCLKSDSSYWHFDNKEFEILNDVADSLFLSNNIQINNALVSFILKQDNTIHNQVLSFHVSEWDKLVDEDSLHGFHRLYTQDNLYVSESIIQFDDCAEVEILDKGNLGPLSRPRWYSLYDVSQSYFNVKLDGNFRDGSLIIDCVGATDYSYMIPEPDVITMSSIEFTDKEKIEQIKSHGLTFHATYKELENFQNARVFLVSALISALLAIFVTFIILAIYKMFKKREFESHDV